MAKEISLFKKRLIIKMSNRNFYSLILLGILILLGGGFLIVNALTPGVAPNPGHLITQVAPPAGCGNGQVLQFIDEDNGWGCVVLPVDTDDQTLSVSGQTLSISEGNSVSLPYANFGGMYSTCDGNGCGLYDTTSVNPLTGSASCPSGFTARRVLRIGDSTTAGWSAWRYLNIYYCYKL